MNNLSDANLTNKAIVKIEELLFKIKTATDNHDNLHNELTIALSNPTTKKILQYENSGAYFDILYSLLKDKNFKCFKLLIDNGFNPFIVGREQISFNNKTFDTVFQYLIEITNNAAEHVKPCLNSIANLASIEQIIHIPFHLLQEKYQLDCLPILRKRFADEIESLQINSKLKTQLKNLLNEENVNIQGYNLLNKISVVAQLINYIKHPYTQDQGDQRTCGVNVIFISMAMHNPNMLIDITLRLLDKGYCHIGSTYISVNEHIKLRCDSIAKLLNQAIKNFVHGEYIPYSKKAEEEQDRTTITEINYILQKLGFKKHKQIVRETTSHSNQFTKYYHLYSLNKKYAYYSSVVKPIKDIPSLIESIKKDDKHIQPCVASFKMKSNLFKKIQKKAHHYLFMFDIDGNNDDRTAHAIVLSNINYNANKKIDLTIYTWGKQIRISVTEEEFLSGLNRIHTFKIPKNYHLLPDDLIHARVTIDTEGNTDLQPKRPKAKL